MKIYLNRKHRELGIGRPVPVIREEVEGGIAYYFEGTEEERQMLIPLGLLAEGPEPVDIQAAEDKKASIDFSSAKQETETKELPAEFLCPKHGKIHNQKKNAAAYYNCLDLFLAQSKK